MIQDIESINEFDLLKLDWIEIKLTAEIINLLNQTSEINFRIWMNARKQTKTIETEWIMKFELELAANARKKSEFRNHSHKFKLLIKVLISELIYENER